MTSLLTPLKRVLTTALYLLVASTSIAFAQGIDSSAKAKPKTLITTRTITFPDTRDRLIVFGVGAILIGGLGLLLNEKRKRADQKIGL